MATMLKLMTTNNLKIIQIGNQHSDASRSLVFSWHKKFRDGLEDILISHEAFACGVMITPALCVYVIAAFYIQKRIDLNRHAFYLNIC